MTTIFMAYPPLSDWRPKIRFKCASDVAEEANCRLIYADLGRGAGDSPEAAYPYINLKFCNTRRLFSRSFNMLLNISAGSKGKLTGQKEDPLEQAPRPLNRGINSQDWIEFRPFMRGSLR
jgi:hypothetical protein